MLSSFITCPKSRVETLDFIRGIDIVLMVIFNYSVTLRYFGLINARPDPVYWTIFPVSIASIFIFISGAAAFSSFQNNKENFSKRYFKRGGKLLFFAAFITLFTSVFLPGGTIYFGILHFFAFTSFLVPLFIRYDKLNLFSGLLIIYSGIYLQIKEFSFPYLFWLGFIPENFSTFDYFPLLPWLGMLLLGIYSGKWIIETTAHMKFRSKLASIFLFLGKNSLTIYLIHQPLLIFLLMVSGFRTFW
ncbi:MAG TPA: heparan-alpha-glucosaminide N-acetyltransferase [Candidatus Methanoperedens sp.]|nr:heparan-alpha-glucosaminide N-acetyltransferase [Candidatus Methanoperedens sp.]